MIQYLERARSGNMTRLEMTSTTTTEASWSRGNRETDVRCFLEILSDVMFVYKVKDC